MSETITYKGKEYVVKYTHYRPPALYGIYSEELDLLPSNYQFTTYTYPLEIPALRDINNVLRTSEVRKVIYVDPEEYSFRKKISDINLKSFEQTTKLKFKRKYPKGVLARFVTQAFLYRLDEWLENPPVIIRKNGERVIVSEGIKPEPVATGLAFCSLKEKSYSKKIGRSIALGRAMKRLSTLVP